MAEFQSEPVKCTLSGSGFPGLARQQHLAGLTGSMTMALPAWGKAERGRVPAPPGVGKGGAGTEHIALLLVFTKQKLPSQVVLVITTKAGAAVIPMCHVGQWIRHLMQ